MTGAILALDVSKTATGWAYGAPGEVPTSGVHRLGADGATEDEVWRNGLVWLNTQMQVLNPDIVAIEAAWDAHHPKETAERQSEQRQVAAQPPAEANPKPVDE